MSTYKLLGSEIIVVVEGVQSEEDSSVEMEAGEGWHMKTKKIVNEISR